MCRWMPRTSNRELPDRWSMARAGVVEWETELRAVVTGRDRCHRRCVDTGDHTKQHPLTWAVELLESGDVVPAVDDDRPDPGVDGQPQLVVGLGVSVKHDLARGYPCVQCGDQLTGTSHVDVQSLLCHDAVDGGAWERLGGERHARAGTPSPQAPR